MRFLLCLSMLLLVATGHAQNDCHITNLTATLSGPDPATCQYYVTLQFEHTGTTNQFVVRGNGIIYDTLPYGSSPVVLGPFTAGAAATTREFVVRDFIFGECQASAQLSIPGCSTQACNIQEQLVAEAGDCNTDSTYHLFLNFTPPNASADSFTVFANDHYFGTYAVSQLPLQIPNFPWNGGAFDVVKVCLDATAGADACCGELEFHVPPCFPYAPCELSQLHINVGTCTSDSTFSAVLDFQVATPAVADSFELWASGHYLGAFSINQLPLTISNFPWNGQIFSNVKVCAGDGVGCCREKQFLAPSCLPFGPCEVSDIITTVGPCSGEEAYKLTINFQGTNPGNGNFTLSANSQVLGIYPLTALPLTIPNFPASGNTNDAIRICVNDVPGTVTCCESKEFHAPNCAPVDSCGILALTVDPGTCTSDSTYQLFLNFQTAISSASGFQVWANGHLFETYTIVQLPLSIPNFPWNGGNNDVVKICLLNFAGASVCCKTVEFAVPPCLQEAPCEIFDVVVDPGQCHADSNTYSLFLNFQVQNPDNDFFEVWANNNQYLGIFPLSDLPLTIPNFPISGNTVDHIKICINDQPNCCKTKEFQPPSCATNDCEIQNLTAQTGECHGDSSYFLLVNFQVTGSTTNTFQLFANGQLFGTYTLSQLPLSIPNFPWNGGNNDVVKVCMAGNSPANTCCKTLEFAVPPCLQTGACEIHELTVQTGECHGDSAYFLLVNFQVTGTTATNFQVFANGQLFGTYPLSQLPLSIPNFPWNGGNNDVIKVCVVTNTISNCCETREFAVPDCLQEGPCEIFDVVVNLGECHPDNNTYSLVVNFQVQNPGNASFEVWAGNGQYLGIFPLSALPLTISNFPWGGGAADHIKICINDHPDCCRTKEFQAPTCFGSDCEVNDLTVQTGECQGDSTYQVLLNFQVTNPPVNTFSVYANGQFFGSFQLNQLPLTIPHFPWNGGNNDVIKVCFGTAGALNCCATLEFAVPDCLMDPCHISDAHVLATPCLCGQFFALVSFDHENGAPGGFDIVGNGHNYGTFPYNTPQPIILGPLAGDNSTMYEFDVHDHLHPDCHDAVQLGKVECPTLATNTPNSMGTLSLSPNPTNNWLNASALLSGGARMGQSTVQVFYADGRLVLTQSVEDGSSFQLEVSTLPAGIYRLAVRSAVGNLEGTFTKM